MSETEPTPPPEESPGPGRLTRSATDRMIAGVSGGLGQYFGTDPLWFRLGFVVLALAGGSGILIYIVAWIVIPEERPGDPARAGNPIGPEGSVIAGVFLVGMGLFLLARQYMPWLGRVFWPAAIIVAGVALIYLGSRRDRA